MQQTVSCKVSLAAHVRFSWSTSFQSAALLHPRRNSASLSSECSFHSCSDSSSRYHCSPLLLNVSSVPFFTPDAKKCSSLYADFVEFAVREVAESTQVSPFPIQEGLKEVLAYDGKTKLHSNAFQSSKMRLFRIANLDGGENMQVLNMAIFPNPEYDLPIFCADFFSTATKHIIVLDLNPLYDTGKNKWYKTKYYADLIPVMNRYIKLLPWGQRLTAESLQFFSPIVIWTKLELRQEVQENLFPAFKEYLQVWLKMMENAEIASNSEEVQRNQRAQHRYLLWRATKDPGRPLLHRLFGEAWCEMYIKDFLFNGATTLGTETFLDYFPEYRCADGSINKERSIVGKSYVKRPWDEHGNFTMAI